MKNIKQAISAGDAERAKALFQIINMDAQTYKVLLELTSETEFYAMLESIHALLTQRYITTKVNKSEEETLFVPEDNKINSLADSRTNIMDDFSKIMGETAVNDAYAVLLKKGIVPDKKCYLKTLLIAMLDYHLGLSASVQQEECRQILNSHISSLENAEQYAKLLRI